MSEKPVAAGRHPDANPLRGAEAAGPVRAKFRRAARTTQRAMAQETRAIELYLRSAELQEEAARQTERMAALHDGPVQQEMTRRAEEQRARAYAALERVEAVRLRLARDQERFGRLWSQMN